MSKRKQNEIMSDDGTYVVKKNRKMNIAAFILCVLVAFIIWLYATNTEEKEREEEKTDHASSVSYQADESAFEYRL